MNIYKYIYETYTILGFDISPQVALNILSLIPLLTPSLYWFPYSSAPTPTYSFTTNYSIFLF